MQGTAVPDAAATNDATPSAFLDALEALLHHHSLLVNGYVKPPLSSVALNSNCVRAVGAFDA